MIDFPEPAWALFLLPREIFEAYYGRIIKEC